MRIGLRGWLTAGLLGSCSIVQAQGFYLGGKIGRMDVNDSAFEETSNAGVLLGYAFEVAPRLGLGIEAELTKSLSDGDIQVFGVQGDWDIETRALYGVLRFGDPLYAKARMGVLKEEVSAQVGGVSAKDSDSGFSYSAGVGWRAHRNAALELEFTQIELDVSYVSVGLVLGY